MKFAKLGIAILLISPFAIAASPQQNPSSGPSASAGQQESVADAARRAKSQKKEEAKSTRVWDNDNIPTINGTISVVGQPSETSAAESSEAPKVEEKPKAEEKPVASLTPEEKADLQSKLDDAKVQLASLKTDLDIAQRKYKLDEQSFVSSPDHDRDLAGAKALQDEKQQIADKQQDIADAQKKVDDLQAQLAAASDGQSK